LITPMSVVSGHPEFSFKLIPEVKRWKLSSSMAMAWKGRGGKYKMDGGGC